MGYAFVGITLIVSAVNNYLIFFNRLGKIPYPVGFNTFAVLAHLSTLVMSIWYLGLLFGIVYFALYQLNILDAGFTWIYRFLIFKKFNLRNEVPELSIGICGSFTFIVIGMILFAIISFFVTKYKSLRYLIEYNDYKFLIGFGIILVLGNIIRIIVMKTMYKEQ
jgi:hypothetical protein